MVDQRYAIIESGTVINIAVASAEFAAQQGWIELPDGFGINDLYDGEKFIRQEEPEVNDVPSKCTPAQGLMALYMLKQITESDIESAIDGIADNVQRYQAQIAYKKATVWLRDSQSMQVVAQLMGLTETDLDDLFTLAVTFENL